MRSISILPAARLEITEAHAWYAQRSVRSADAFAQEIDRQLARIAETPEQFPEMLAPLRRARLRRFPFGIFFIASEDTCFVIACFHSSRDPRQLRSRT